MSQSSSRKDRVRNEGLRQQPGRRNAYLDLGDSSRSPRPSRSPAHSLNECESESHDYKDFVVRGGKGTVIGSSHVHHHYGRDAQRNHTYHQSSSEVQYDAPGLYPLTFPHQIPPVMARPRGTVVSCAPEILRLMSPGFRLAQGNLEPLPPQGDISHVIYYVLAQPIQSDTGGVPVFPAQLRNTNVSAPESGATLAHRYQTPSTTETGRPSSTRQTQSQVKSGRIGKSKKKKKRKKKYESRDTDAGHQQQA